MPAMNVVHFSITPLAGMPIRLVQALNRHTPVQARLIDLKRFGLFDHDLVMAEDPEACLEAAQKADIIHLHNYLDLDSTQFAPIDFRELQKRGALFVRHFHSTPQLVAQTMGITVERLMRDDLPWLVIAQYPERLYPRAMLVPNLIPQDQPAYLPLAPGDEPDWDILFSPTKSFSAWEERWNTKGQPETRAVLEEVARRTGARVKVMTDRPLAEVLREKQRSRIVVDDLVNGTYHLSGMEGLAMGKCVLSLLDDRIRMLLREFSGGEEPPVVNVRLEESLDTLLALMDDPEAIAGLGKAARHWMETRWSEERMIGYHVRAYELLTRDPALVKRQEHLALDSPAKRFLWQTHPEIVYQARADKAKGQ